MTILAGLCIVAVHAGSSRGIRLEDVSHYVTLPVSELTSVKCSNEFQSLAAESKDKALRQVQFHRKTDRREALVHLIGLLRGELTRAELNQILTLECAFQADERVIEALLKAGAGPTEDCFQLICWNKTGGYRALATLAKELDIAYAITSPSAEWVQYAALMHNLDVLKFLIQLGGDPFRRRDLSVVGGCLGSVLKGVDAAEAAAYLEHAEVDDAEGVLDYLITNFSSDPRFPTRQKLLSIARNRKAVIADEGWRTRDTYEYFVKWLSKVPFHTRKGA